MKKMPYKKFSVSRLLPKINQPASIPGTVKYIGVERQVPATIDVLKYNDLTMTEAQVNSLSELPIVGDVSNITWINIVGVHDESIIKDTGGILQIHPLVLEDIVNTTQRPKVEDHDDYIFAVVKMAYFDEESKEIMLEQVSLISGKNYLITLQEKKGDVLDGVRNRIRNNTGKIRKMGSDYLLYAIIDAIIDNYFTVLEQIGEQIENLDTELFQNANQHILHKMYSLKRELIYLRKSIWPMREVVNSIQRMENALISDSSSLYFRDIYDHTVQVMETVETFRDMITGMLDLYLSTVSNKMNEVMKVLTIFAAIFIPLTFIAGVYGMNFEFMPELKWKFSYPAWWGITILLTVSMVIFFKRRKWL